MELKDESGFVVPQTLVAGREKTYREKLVGSLSLRLFTGKPTADISNVNGRVFCGTHFCREQHFLIDLRRQHTNWVMSEKI